MIPDPEMIPDCTRNDPHVIQGMDYMEIMDRINIPLVNNCELIAIILYCRLYIYVYAWDKSQFSIDKDRRYLKLD